MSDSKTTYIMPDQNAFGNNDLATIALLGNGGGFGGNGMWNNPFMYLVWLYMMRWMNGGDWSQPDIEEILSAVERAGGSQKVLKQAHANLMEDYNSGFTYTSSKYRKSIMVVNRSSSMEEFINTYNHEKNHVEMHICEELGIDPYSEEAAYLSGNMAQ